MLTKLLIANRGEIAIRIARAAADLGMATVSVFSTDDEASAHVRHTDQSVPLVKAGAAGYLDGGRLIEIAIATGCDAVHPGYGFLSENASFARMVADAGLIFVGPTPAHLELFGDKVRARQAARAIGVAVLEASGEIPNADAVRTFAAGLGATAPIIIKAVAGGGGRGLRVVENLATVEAAFSQASAEAWASFGNGALYVERFLPAARHIEVQVVGDGTGAVIHFGDRDCSVQRRHQKLVEIAPAPELAPDLRERLTDAAVRLARSVDYLNLGTVEFLVDASAPADQAAFYFIEANPRLQVEHTVTEEVTGVDLVELQLRLAGDHSLADLGLDQAAVPAPRGYAIQMRVNLETVQPDGATLPSGGTLGPFDLPTGPGVRVDTFGYAGYSTSASFDSLLAKVVVHRASSTFAEVAIRAERALSECRIGGVRTNVDFLRNIVSDPDFLAGRLTTRFVEDHLSSLTMPRPQGDPSRRFAPEPHAATATIGGRGVAGVRLQSQDPLAVLDYGKAASVGLADGRPPNPANQPDGPPGTLALVAPLQGTIVSLPVEVGDAIRVGQLVAVMESMKMQHEIRAVVAGTVVAIGAAEGDAVFADHPLVFFEPSDSIEGEVEDVEVPDLDHIRPDLAEILARHALTRDDARPKAVARRRATGQRTARENVEDLCDEGTLVEYGPMVVAAQHRRRSMEELLEKSPADGMITGVGSINGGLFGDPASRCAVMAYDYTVFAGTQGIKNHQKTDRLVSIAEQGRMPLVLFAEGGGGRPGDTDGGDQGTWTFNHFARLSGLAPMVGITSGRCFAGNASLLGCCDVIIATEGSNIGMGGPAMIEGGGLGVFAPEEIGPLDVQLRSGVVDIAVADEAEAVAVAKQYLSYFQGPVEPGDAADQRLMRPIIPENRLRVYDVRRVIETLADIGSVLELRRHFGVGIVTSLIRVAGRPIGVVANNPMHLGGAIDSDGSDKGARFMQLCDAFDIPILFLVDTPGIMVGPEVEKTALVRHSSRMFLVGANLSVPCYTIILRKAYGLGCIAVSGASFRAPLFTVAWLTGEFGGMGLEGSVKLGFREVLASIQDPAERVAVYEKMVAKAYEKGKALRYATGFAIDDTIDPADSRRWLANLMASVRSEPRGPGKKRPFIDAW